MDSGWPQSFPQHGLWMWQNLDVQVFPLPQAVGACPKQSVQKAPGSLPCRSMAPLAGRSSLPHAFIQ